MPLPSPPRRVTRSSLARFAYRPADSTNTAATEDSIPDIEDVIPSSSRKRKRGTTTPITPSRSNTAAGATTTRTTTIKAEVKTEAPPSTAKRKAHKPARKVKDEDGAVKVEPPSDWEEMYELVKQMRLGDGPAANAAVDTMGCSRLAEPGASERDRRFQTLIALMLSSQTKDTVNAVAMRRLQTELPAATEGGKVGLNLENILAVEPAKLNELIGLVGFHNNKTKYIKAAALLLRDKFNGDIPDTIEGLVSLPGVGPKMAYLCMSVAWKRTEGIGVDVHVHRITNMWGWNKTKNPEETRLALQSWLPRDKWHEINWLLVGFGQAVCLPIGRRCGECTLAERGLCKAVDRKKVAEARARAVKREVVKKEEAAESKEIVKSDEEAGEDKEVVKDEEKAEKDKEAVKDEEEVRENKEAVKDEEDAEEDKKVVKTEEEVTEEVVIKDELVHEEEGVKRELDVVKRERVDEVKNEVKMESVEDETTKKEQFGEDDGIKHEEPVGDVVLKKEIDVKEEEKEKVQLMDIIKPKPESPVRPRAKRPRTRT